MLVTTAISGRNSRNEPSDSSLSATNQGPSPLRALLPVSMRSPPTATLGSSPAASSTRATIAVVVVLPCVPAMAMPRRPSINWASSAPRCTIGTSCSRAATTSGFASPIAVLTTTVPAVPMLRAS